MPMTITREHWQKDDTGTRRHYRAETVTTHHDTLSAIIRDAYAAWGADDHVSDDDRSVTYCKTTGDVDWTAWERVTILEKH
jgi:hypothetical protein